MKQGMNSLVFLAVGSELLSGDVAETNGRWLQRRLRGRKVRFSRTLVIPDELDVVAREIRAAVCGGDVLVISGGLGPTDDDLSREALAEALSLSLEFRPEWWERIQAYFRERGRSAGPSNRKQAMFPAGAIPLENRKGTAPGIYLESGGSSIYCFPGVPSEFKEMAEEHLLRKYPAEGPSDRIIRCEGIGESKIMDLINENSAIPEGFPWGTVAAAPGVDLRLPAEAAARPDFAAVHGRLLAILGSHVYAEDESDPRDILAGILMQEKLTVACAESCTGGMLGSWLTARPGSSAWMLGAVVAYHNGIKRDILGVPQFVLDREGAVSERCSALMANGVRGLFKSDLGIAVTGIAGPDGGTNDKPVGTVFIAAATASAKAVSAFRFFGDREGVRERSCHAACLLAWKLVSGRPV